MQKIRRIRTLIVTASIALTLVASAAASAAHAAPPSSSPSCERVGVGAGAGKGRDAGKPPACGFGREASVLYFQDAHEIMPVPQADGERGGVARLATVVKEQRALHPDAALAFGGDAAGGTLFGGVYRGMPLIEAFNAIGVDVASFGQHDFDFGPDHTLDLVAASDFPWVNSNLVAPGGEAFLPGYPTSVQDVNGIDVGFFGLTGGMATTNAEGIVERDSVQAAREAVADLEARGADVVIALTQIDRDQNVALLEAVPEIDAAFREENSYVSASEITTLDDGRLVLSAEGNYGSVLRLDIERSGNGYTLSVDELQVDASIAEDPQLDALATAYQDRLEERLSDPIGSAPAYLDRPAVRQIVADAFRSFADSDVALFNSGGARADIPGPTVTMRDAYAVQPFGNVLVQLEVTGAQLEAAIEAAPERLVPAGLTYTLHTGATGAERVTELRTTDGAPVDPTADYTLAATTYVVNGNPVLSAITTTGGVADVQALIDHIVEVGTLTADAPRVTVVP